VIPVSDIDSASRIYFSLIPCIVYWKKISRKACEIYSESSKTGLFYYRYLSSSKVLPLLISVAVCGTVFLGGII
jgi:hypothetical protein